MKMKKSSKNRLKSSSKKQYGIAVFYTKSRVLRALLPTLLLHCRSLTSTSLVQLGQKEGRPLGGAFVQYFL